MKDLLEKRVQDLTLEAQKTLDAYNEAGVALNKLAQEHNIALIRLEEARELLAQAVKLEVENKDALCKQEAECLSTCDEAGSSQEV